MENQEEKEFLFYKNFLLYGISTNLNARVLNANVENLNEENDVKNEELKTDEHLKESKGSIEMVISSTVEGSDSLKSDVVENGGGFVVSASMENLVLDDSSTVSLSGSKKQTEVLEDVVFLKKEQTLNPPEIESAEKIVEKLRSQVRSANGKKDLDVGLQDFKSSIQNVENLKRMSKWQLLQCARSVAMVSMIEKRANESFEQWREKSGESVTSGVAHDNLNLLKQVDSEGVGSLESSNSISTGNVTKSDRILVATSIGSGSTNNIIDKYKSAVSFVSKTGNIIKGKLSKSTAYNIKKQIYFNKYKVFNFIERTMASSRVLSWYLTSPSESGAFDIPHVSLYVKELCEKYNLGSISESSSTSNYVTMERLSLLDLHLSKLCKRFGIKERDIGQGGALNVNLINQKSWHYFLNTAAMFHLNEFSDGALSSDFKEVVSEKAIEEHCCLSFDPSAKNATFDLEHEWWHFVDSRLQKKAKSMLPDIDLNVKKNLEVFFKENFSSSDISSMVSYLKQEETALYDVFDSWCSKNKLWNVEDVVACVFNINNQLNVFKTKDASRFFYSHQTEKVKSLLPGAQSVFNKMWSNIQGVSEFDILKEKQAHSELYERLYKNLGDFLGRKLVGEYGVNSWEREVNFLLYNTIKRVSCCINEPSFKSELEVLLGGTLGKNNLEKTSQVKRSTEFVPVIVKVEDGSEKLLRLESFRLKAASSSFVDKMNKLDSEGLVGFIFLRERFIAQIAKVLPAFKKIESSFEPMDCVEKDVSLGKVGGVGTSSKCHVNAFDSDGEKVIKDNKDTKTWLLGQLNLFTENNIKDILHLSILEHTYGLVLSEKSVYAQKSVAMIADGGTYWCTPSEMCARAISRALPWENFYKEDPYPTFSYKRSLRLEQYVKELVDELGDKKAQFTLNQNANDVGDRLSFLRSTMEVVSKKNDNHLKVVAGFEGTSKSFVLRNS